ncbi:MAG: Smr/MutS family protein [Tannerella sp.]|jgi:DNA mismatch repair protein MutS2|nr:Smr/MutS family protein [Tannerella sp.]
MIYPNNFEQKIGFDKVRQLINEKCLSELGKENVGKMCFSTSHPAISMHLNRTGEFVRILHGDREFPVNHYIDVRYSLQRIRPENTFLDEKELFDLRRSLQTIDEMIRFFRKEREDHNSPYPALTALAGNIPVFPDLIKKIDTILDKYGHIKDNASPELARIRKEIHSVTGSISRTLHHILRSAQSEGLVDKDTTPTMRDGRLVIPVAPAFKRKLRGIVHDESATGKTVFIEPEAVVESNNRIRELENMERKEIVRILTVFTDSVRPLVPDMLHSYEFMGEIDFIRAKALFAGQINAIQPVVEDRPLIEWTRAVHPLLFLSLQKQNKPVEPLDITLAGTERLLVISGPNAGGKSVCLKTVGLLQYMLQCGLLIPLHEQSRTGLFTRIFIDIGDEQSIENDLSTYSSHLINMKFFFRNGNENALLLIDEFGSGTEPVIGGALAEALLERFNRNRSFGVITTHYHNLKQMAETTEGIINGAMLYDRHLMQPLFKLSIGHPGSSFAIEIARKIGLPEDVITDASQKVGSAYIDLDKYLQDIVRDKRYWETKRQNIRSQEKKLEALTARYEQELETINRQRKEILNTAKTQATQILAGTNAKIEQTIREIKEVNAEKEQTKTIRRSFDDFRKEVVEMETTENRKIEESRQTGKHGGIHPKRKNRQKSTDIENPINRRKSAPQDLKPLSPGDAVRLKDRQAVGEILEISDKHAIVAFGMIKTTVKISQLEKADKAQIKKEPVKITFISRQTADSLHEKKLHFKPDIDVRGMRGDEALQAVMYFIDDAIQINASRIRILHGTGNGILRELIRNYLQTTPGIRHFCDEHVQFGGTGITVIDLD